MDDNEQKLPNRDVLRLAFAERIADACLVERLMKAFEPFFVRAETGFFRLATRSRANKFAINWAITSAFRIPPAEVELVSLSKPVQRQGWMTDDGYAYFREVAFAYALRTSAKPWFDSALKQEFGPLFAAGRADWSRANELLHDAFGNLLNKAVNGSLFSGAMYPVESTLTHLIAFALVGELELVERLLPLVQLLPRSIPLGRRADSENVWVVLVA
jgi:hypothetical protein